MLALGDTESVPERLRALNIIPVAISYEYDPNDVEKASELHFRETLGSYEKKRGEDHEAMIRGLRNEAPPSDRNHFTAEDADYSPERFSKENAER